MAIFSSSIFVLSSRSFCCSSRDLDSVSSSVLRFCSCSISSDAFNLDHLIFRECSYRNNRFMKREYVFKILFARKVRD